MLKVDRINDAYSRMRVSGLTVVPTPEDLETALQRMENMLAQFEARNICLGYNFEDEPDPNSVTNVERWAWDLIATNLAIRLIPDFNKAVPQALINEANQTLSFASGKTAKVRQVDYPRRQPVGSGNTLRYNRWARFYRPQGQTPLECASVTMAVDDVRDFVEHFDAYLDFGETLSSFTIEADAGLTIVSSSLSSPDVLYRIKAEGADNSASDSFQQVKIIATTDAGRIETRLVNFAITGT